ncbi:M48 family metallopeptidase [Pleomorphomonas sp. JP5]|uniref:M48 family metallopeptidase n=1 Tax=Pleomorphomonas sp. JP5 TaxID=2942998 RepID=UPI0020441DE3|nr:SprT family zinc-dependent metalloprotease [Pleomorphomonas sp. JP5]MCM5559697.1 M48 family metallopeptidase [Pleomorphomonas sp. JP5]
MPIRLPFLQAPEKKRSPPTSFPILAGERTIEVTVRRNARARRYTLRLDRKGDGAVVTIPRRGSLAEAKAFVARHAGWIADRLVSRPDIPDVPAAVSIRGVVHRVIPTGSPRGSVRLVACEGGPAIEVPGEAPHVRRRLADHLKKEARADLTAAVARHADALGVRPSAIRLKDTTSRWGSASARGVLAFSWRLVMAPPFVLDYVAAHEVAHLREMNHSDRFWAICEHLCPAMDAAKDWLKKNGAGLHRQP